MAAINTLQQDNDTCRDLVAHIIDKAKQCGASAAEVGVNINKGLSVNVREGEVETLEHHNDRGLGVTVYFGQRKGSASTSDLNMNAVDGALQAACDIARFTAEDPCSGLADEALMARNIPDLELDHPWDITPLQAIELAQRSETVAREADARIVNTDGASLSSVRGSSVYGNSHGFIGAYNTTRHSLSCSVIGEQDGNMQRDYWYSVARDSKELETPEAVGGRAAERTLQRLGAVKLSTRQCPVIISADLARGLLGHFVSAISGGALYRQASFLLDYLGKRVFPEFVCIQEQPHLKRALGSAAFDSEGVATHSRDIVIDGVLQSYVLSSYSACRLGLETTGNAGGVHNLGITPGEQDLQGLIRAMNTGLLVTELIGHGVNTVTGDYSRGAAGFWVENGELAYPVEEITIAGNLKEMFMQIVAVANDVDRRGSIYSGSLLIEQMTIAGE